MSILSDNKLPVVVPESDEVKQMKLKNIANNIVNSARETFNNLVQTQRRGIDIVWNNNEFTPQEILNELGDRAPAIFTMHGELSDFITSLATANNVEVDLKAPTHSFTLSGNTIVVGDPL